MKLSNTVVTPPMSFFALKCTPFHSGFEAKCWKLLKIIYVNEFSNSLFFLRPSFQSFNGKATVCVQITFFLCYISIDLFSFQGKLIISPSNSRDMQLLVRMLGIDPDNVRVEALEESAKKRMVQSQLTASMGLMTHNPSSPQADNQEMQSSQTPTNSKANKSKSQGKALYLFGY